MPRDGSGIYSLPASTAAVSGALAESNKVNSRFSDLEADNNAARPISSGGTGATSAASAAANLFVEVAKLMYRVGDLKITRDNVNPGTYITGTTWVSASAGRAIIGVGNNGDSTWAEGDQRGSETHTLTVGETPAHDHDVSGTTGAGGAHNHVQGGGAGINGGRYSFVDTGIANANTEYDPGVDGRGSYTSTAVDHTHSFSATSTSVGADGAHNNIQPSEAFYVWERTA